MSLYNQLHLDPSLLEIQLVMHEELGVGSRDYYCEYWGTYFWTPPGPQGQTTYGAAATESYYGDLSSVFQSPEDFNPNLLPDQIFTINAVGEKEVTTYHSAIGTQSANVGIASLSSRLFWKHCW